MEKEKEKQGHNTIETMTFVFGIIVLATLIGFLIFQWSNKEDQPASLIISTSYQPSMKNYGFKVEVENKGDQTAEAAHINLSLYQNGKLAETGTIEFQYVPVKSKETGYIVFHTQRKSGDSLVVSSVTYAEP